jgi:4-amino-4-deoxy-L-arabinose transferase-like glycosyltransferase
MSDDPALITSTDDAVTVASADDGSQAVSRIARAYRWCVSRPQLMLTLVVLAALSPFLGKAFNIDDPLFLWAARQIQAHPTDPYGFDVNWYGFPLPMWEVTKNPPLACYFLAAAGSVLGTSEIALHFACLLPAVAVILGTYRLARRWCQQPLLAACATLFTPVYLVSSTTVMCDTLMLAFWVWAVVLWVEGMEDESDSRLAGAALLVALSALTKYFGICLIPLLFSYSLILKRRLGSWAGMFLIPAAILAVYQRVTRALYGQGLLSDAAGYASSVREESGVSEISAALAALSFTGGCLAIATLCLVWLWRPRVLLGFLLFGAVVASAIFSGQAMPGLDDTGASRRFLQSQAVLWVVGGAGVLSMAAAAAFRWRDASSFLLAAWIVGTFLFAGFVNWTINARSILPMAPAVGILLARRLSQVGSMDHRLRRWGVGLSLLTGAVLSLYVARGDFLLAGAVRESARQSYAKLGPKNGTLWFTGHWGFQYYLQELGPKAKAFVKGHWQAKEGDLLANPSNNNNVVPPRKWQYDSRETLSIDVPGRVTTLNSDVGAGFYVSTWGPLPFSFASVPAEKVSIYRLKAIGEAKITLVTADRNDLNCAAKEGIQGFTCGFTSQLVASPGDEQTQLKPFYTVDGRLLLVPGLFLEPAIRARYQSELPNKPRKRLKRFTANCQLRVIGTLASVRTRWSAKGKWTPPEDIEVGTVSKCKIDD